MSEIVNQIIIGIQMGSIYALVALGYTMVYGIIKLINFAHGDFIMVACFMLYTFIIILKLPAILGLILAILITIIIGVLTERVAYRPLRKKKSPTITALITAIAVSLILENLFQLLFGSDSKMYPDLIKQTTINIGKISVSNISLITIIVSIVTMILLTLFIKKTKVGKAMRAVSENSDAAQLMGINVDRTISITFIIGTFLAGIAAIMYYMKYLKIEPFLGSNLGLYAFVAAVVGGIGSIPGACVGGFLIGIIKVLPNIMSINSSYADIFLFGLLIIILIFKPTGIFGKNIGEQV